MAKKKKKPSKRGKKAYKISLHLFSNDCNTGEEDKKIGKMD